MVCIANSILPGRPQWLDALLTIKFFLGCSRHAAPKKNERNIFCVDCHDGICQHCLPAHSSHRLIQIRRYVYHDVVRLVDVNKLLDTAGVQTYIINSARVVFLNQRPQPRPSKGLGNICATCDRALQDPYKYCSVACKVDHVLDAKKNLKLLLPKQPLQFSNNSSDSSSSAENGEFDSPSPRKPKVIALPTRPTIPKGIRAFSKRSAVSMATTGLGALDMNDRQDSSEFDSMSPLVDVALPSGGDTSSGSSGGGMDFGSPVLKRSRSVPDVLAAVESRRSPLVILPLELPPSALPRLESVPSVLMKRSMSVPAFLDSPGSFLSLASLSRRKGKPLRSPVM